MGCSDSDLFRTPRLLSSSRPGNISRHAGNGFLLAFCFFGQLSNQLMCMRNAFLISGILNRTLLYNDNTEESYYGVDTGPSIDVERMNSCFGNDSVLSTSDYVKKYGKQVAVDEAICWYPRCPSPKRYNRPYEAYKSIIYDKAAEYKVYENESFRMNVSHLLNLFGNAKGRVLTIGELYHPRIEGYVNNNWFYNPFKRAPSCKYTLDIIPRKYIMDAAFSFVNETFGSRSFLALHWRRGDFSSFCKSDKTFTKNCFRPLRTVAYCITEKALKYNLSVIYVASNEKREKMTRLKEAVKALEPSLSVLFLENKETNPIESHMKKYNISSSRFRGLAFEKVVCALSGAFLATPYSSFSEDIERLRYGLKTANCKDSFICEGLSFDS